jgi:hypothetical protein
MKKSNKFSYSRPDEQSVRVAFDGTTYVLRVKREGVHSSQPWEGGLIRVPAWIFTRARWHARLGQNWVAETRQIEKASLHTQLGGRPITTELFPTKDEAVDRANALLVEWGVPAPTKS